MAVSDLKKCDNIVKIQEISTHIFELNQDEIDNKLITFFYHHIPNNFSESYEINLQTESYPIRKITLKQYINKIYVDLKRCSKNLFDCNCIYNYYNALIYHCNCNDCSRPLSLMTNVQMIHGILCLFSIGKISDGIANYEAKLYNGLSEMCASNDSTIMTWDVLKQKQKNKKFKFNPAGESKVICCSLFCNKIVKLIECDEKCDTKLHDKKDCTCGAYDKYFDAHKMDIPYGQAFCRKHETFKNIFYTFYKDSQDRWGRSDLIATNWNNEYYNIIYMLWYSTCSMMIYGNIKTETRHWNYHINKRLNITMITAIKMLSIFFENVIIQYVTQTKKRLKVKVIQFFNQCIFNEQDGDIILHRLENYEKDTIMRLIHVGIIFENKNNIKQAKLKLDCDFCNKKNVIGSYFDNDWNTKLQYKASLSNGAYGNYFYDNSKISFRFKCNECWNRWRYHQLNEISESNCHKDYQNQFTRLVCSIIEQWSISLLSKEMGIRHICKLTNFILTFDKNLSDNTICRRIDELLNKLMY